MKTAVIIPLALLAFATLLPAAEHVSDDFSFGPGVRDRENTTVGSFLGGLTTPVGEAQWESPASDERSGHSNLQFIFTNENGGGDKGLVTYPYASIASGYLVFDFPTEEGTVVASVDFIANESFPNGGGIWIGFTADSPVYLGLLGDKADHVAVRFNPDARGPENAKLSYQSNIGGNAESKTTGSGLQGWKPDQVTRLTLSYDAKSRQFVGRVERIDQPDAPPLEISGTIESATIFNHIQFEMTGQNAISTTIKKAVFRKIDASLKKQ